LTYNPRLAKVNPHAKTKVKRFKQESAHRQTDGHTHTDIAKRMISHCHAVNNKLLLMCSSDAGGIQAAAD